VHGCFTALCSVQQDKSEDVIPNAVRNPVRCGCFTSLRSVQHDKLKMANLTLLSLALQKERDVCASRQGEVAFRARQESSAWMLHCAMLRSAGQERRCHSERSEESSAMWMLHYACAPFSMTNWRWQTSPCCPSPCKRRGTSAPADRVRSIQRVDASLRSA
jgi:hypothetical protein